MSNSIKSWCYLGCAVSLFVTSFVQASPAKSEVNIQLVSDSSAVSNPNKTWEQHHMAAKQRHATKGRQTKKSKTQKVPQLEQKYDTLWKNRETEDGQRKIISEIFNDKNVPKTYAENWKLGRLAYFAVHFGFGEQIKQEKKESILKLGYRASEAAAKMEPNKVEGHYWYAVDVGAYGVIHGILSALEMVEVSVKSLEDCVRIDPRYHWAGPYRVLGRYYYEAPSFISIGDLDVSERYLKKALELEPNFNVNLMYMGILQMKKGDKKKALAYFKKAKSVSKQDGPFEEKRYAREIEKNIKLAQQD